MSLGGWVGIVLRDAESKWFEFVWNWLLDYCSRSLMTAASW